MLQSMFSLVEGINSFLYIFSIKIFSLLYTLHLEVPETRIGSRNPNRGAFGVTDTVRSRRFSSQRCEVTDGPHQAASLMQV